MSNITDDKVRELKEWRKKLAHDIVLTHSRDKQAEWIKICEVIDNLLASREEVREQRQLLSKLENYGVQFVLEEYIASRERVEELIELMRGDCKYCKYNAFPSKCEGCFHGPSTCIESHWEFIALTKEEG